jgi:HSP20 family molecular chaperone IbpA
MQYYCIPILEIAMNQLAQLETTKRINTALVGFDSILDDATSKNSNYPPYNIIKYSENHYEIQVAITGFDKNDVTVELDRNSLIVKGHTDAIKAEVQYLHRGLATRDFNRQFTLAEHMEIRGAVIKNGLLAITIIRNIPEESKPKMIDIVELP